LVFLSLVGCSNDPAPILTKQQKKIVDSIYNKHLREIRKGTDKDCDHLRDSLYSVYVDSILELRLIEVDQIINDN
jgi:hypothetical protein